MPQKRVMLSSDIVRKLQEVLPVDDLEDETIDEYKTLNEKCDQVIVKIKNRKEKKVKKNKK